MQLHPPTVSSKVIATTDSPSAIELVNVHVAISSDEGISDYRRVRGAIDALNYCLAEQVRVEYCPQDYDCTGQTYTTGLDRLKLFIHKSDAGYELIGIYLHHTAVDV